jgi:hypothetical protein
MRNVYCGLDAIIDSKCETMPEAVSPAPREPKVKHQQSYQNSGPLPESSSSQCGLSPGLPSQSAEHTMLPTTPPTTPRPDRYSINTPRTVSPLRVKVLESLLPSPSKPFAERIDCSSSPSSSPSSTPVDAEPSDAADSAAPAGVPIPTLAPADYDQQFLNDELREFVSWSHPHHVILSHIAQITRPPQWNLQHGDDPAKFIRWISEQNVFAAADCCTVYESDILDNAAAAVLHSVVHDTIIDALLRV